MKMLRATLMAAVMFAEGSASAQPRIVGGVGVGTLQVGTGDGSFAVSPHAGVGWRRGAWLLEGHYTALVIPERNGIGHTHQLLFGAGGDLWQTGATIVVGGSFTGYRVVACGDDVCGPVLGVAAGVHTRADYAIRGPFGLSATAGVDWFGGRSRALPGGIAVTLTVGPSFTFGGAR